MLFPAHAQGCVCGYALVLVVFVGKDNLMWPLTVLVALEPGRTVRCILCLLWMHAAHGRYLQLATGKLPCPSRTLATGKLPGPSIPGYRLQETPKHSASAQGVHEEAPLDTFTG